MHTDYALSCRWRPDANATNDAFCETKLNENIGEFGADQLTISGWATDLCVDSTIRSAVGLGYNVGIEMKLTSGWQ